MKTERGSFTATGSVVYVVLNDYTLTPDRVIFWIDGTYKTHGYDDLTRQIANYGTGTQVKDDRSIYLHNGTNVIMSGKCDLFDVGEIKLSFDVRTADTINFVAIED